ncbi:MAG: helix-hairpin-helix domain-containing protein [wastewater metagenome]|nr:helix-hairpin-helix domain-containing protein [Candidatus Loosdrechtia aerotolerans]
MTLTQEIGFCLAGEKLEGTVNINTAAKGQIALLPGIGPKIAEEIVNYRAHNGDFKTIEDMKKVKGIGGKKLEKIKNYITMEGETTIKSTKIAKAEKELKQKKDK